MSRIRGSVVVAAAIGYLGCSETSGPSSGRPAFMLSAAPENQLALPRNAVPIAPSVRILDANHVPLSGTEVTFTVFSGGGTITDGVQRTDADGIATAGEWKLGRGYGVQKLLAKTEGLPPVELTAIATAPLEGVLAFMIEDPIGDTSTAHPADVHALDIVGLRGEFKRDSLILSMTFTHPIERDVGDWEVFIRIDTDSNLSTPERDGFEFQLSYTNRDDVARIWLRGSGRTRPVHEIAENSLTFHIPMSSLGTLDDYLQVAADVYGYNEFVEFSWDLDSLWNGGEETR